MMQGVPGTLETTMVHRWVNSWPMQRMDADGASFKEAPNESANVGQILLKW